MKKFFLIIGILSAVIYGQVSADLTVENQQVIGTDFFFDLYLTRTATNDLYLDNADFVFTFDAVNFSSPVFSKEGTAPGFCTFVPTDQSGYNTLITQMNYFNNTSVDLLNGNQLMINLNGPTPGDITAFNSTVAWINDLPSTHRLGRFKVSGIINPGGFMNLQWKTNGTGIITQVFTLAPVAPWISTLININAINPPNAPLSSSQTTFQLSVSVANGWNMVSIPGLHPLNQDVLTWWSGKDPTANVFRYLGGYQSVTTVIPGTGYWMKHSGANTYSTGDEWPASGINIVAHDPISANTGWNLIGGYEYNAAVSGITTTPSGLQDSWVYGYSGGYQIVDYLIPGYSYWIKLTAPGLINLPGSLQKENKSVEYINNDWGKIIFTDASAKKFILYTTETDVNLNYYELPPLPPEGLFDIRFDSENFVEDLRVGKKGIELNGITYPLFVQIENTAIRIQDETGKVVNSLLKSGEEITLNNRIDKLFVSSIDIPEKYSLEQNYPNPFNPATRIEFSLLDDVNNATLTIYNALGQKVSELVNSGLEAGRYSYIWDANDAATGLYIYELRTDNFVSVKKMILMK